LARATVEHIMLVEWLWLERWRGTQLNSPVKRLSSP
jgi:hypothetical protein